MPFLKPKLAIISSRFKGEYCGLLGPQIAATVLEENTSYQCIVLAVTRDDPAENVKKALAGYFVKEKPLIAFSTLHGRPDLFSLAGELRKEGAVTFLAGPQAKSDFIGEVGCYEHPYRFQGYADQFSFAVHGPAEQAVDLIKSTKLIPSPSMAGLLLKDYRGEIVQNTPRSWNEQFLKKVNWNNIYKLQETELVPLKINSGQVLQQIGCPHAARSQDVFIDYPVSLKSKGKVHLKIQGCSFCDVASDKGYFGKLSLKAVLSQIFCLPEDEEGRKIPFELINESPLPGLPGLLQELEDAGILPSQIRLTLRADWLLKGQNHLLKALELASKRKIGIQLSSVGFESFNDHILRNLNKGLSKAVNLKAVKLMRELKNQFKTTWSYSGQEGAVHGFIHPTPWDAESNLQEMQRTITSYGLDQDILPRHSVPLIIHHGSHLGDWIRTIESRECIRFPRQDSIICWWEDPIPITN